jgi:hypothetical protein
MEREKEAHPNLQEIGARGPQMAVYVLHIFIFSEPGNSSPNPCLDTCFHYPATLDHFAKFLSMETIGFRVGLLLPQIWR